MKNEIFIDNSNEIFLQEFKSKKLMTDAEKNFYKIVQYFNVDYIIQPQINLASIIKIKDKRKISELFKNIDYGIFDKSYNILLLIELNDSTHLLKNRIIRDKKIKNICKKANIPLLTFYTRYKYDKDYIINRIENELKKTKN